MYFLYYSLLKIAVLATDRQYIKGLQLTLDTRIFVESLFR